MIRAHFGSVLLSTLGAGVAVVGILAPQLSAGEWVGVIGFAWVIFRFVVTPLVRQWLIRLFQDPQMVPLMSTFIIDVIRSENVAPVVRKSLDVIYADRIAKTDKMKDVQEEILDRQRFFNEAILRQGEELKLVPSYIRTMEKMSYEFEQHRIALEKLVDGVEQRNREFDEWKGEVKQRWREGDTDRRGP